MDKKSAKDASRELLPLARVFIKNNGMDVPVLNIYSDNNDSRMLNMRLRTNMPEYENKCIDAYVIQELKDMASHLRLNLC